jgi:hypothetical protein
MANNRANLTSDPILTPTAAVSSAALSPRAILFALACIALAIACVVLALQYFVAERLPELTEANLQAGMDQWQKNGPVSYDLNVELRGAQPGHVHVEVRQREVENETRDGRTPGRWTWDTWSVPGLFDTLSQDLAIAENPEGQAAQGTKWRLQCDFDPQLGYPKQYHRLVTGGPEVFWRVTDFESK